MWQVNLQAGIVLIWYKLVKCFAYILSKIIQLICYVEDIALHY